MMHLVYLSDPNGDSALSDLLLPVLVIIFYYYDVLSGLTAWTGYRGCHLLCHLLLLVFFFFIL